MIEIKYIAYANPNILYLLIWCLSGLFVSIIFLIHEKWEQRQREKYVRMSRIRANKSRARQMFIKHSQRHF